MTSKIPGSLVSPQSEAGVTKPVPMTFEEAQSIFIQARDAYKRAEEQKHRSSESRSVLEREMQLAAHAENYERAATLKKERDALPVITGQKLKDFALVAQAAYEKMTELFFAANPEFKEPGEVTLTRVVVVDPATMRRDEAIYVDSSHTIQLHVAGKHFESEAYHLGEWALEHGFMCEHISVDVKV
jgi:hypothetical protein